jgi:hypothetical protein
MVDVVVLTLENRLELPKDAHIGASISVVGLMLQVAAPDLMSPTTQFADKGAAKRAMTTGNEYARHRRAPET